MADKIAVTVDEVFSKLPLEEVSLIKNYLALLFKWHATNNIVSSSDEEYVIKREIFDSSIPVSYTHLTLPTSDLV